MTVYGVLTQHTTPADGPRVNRWWVNQDSIGEALDRAVDIVDAIKHVFGTQCQFNKVHAWLPGQSPNAFQNRPLATPGLYTSSNPVSAIVVARVEFAAGTGNYPNYKDFRCCVNSDQQVGRFYSESFSTSMVTVLTSLDAFDFLCTRDGTPLTEPSYSNTVRYRQLSKKWYDRAPANATLKQLIAVDA